MKIVESSVEDFISSNIRKIAYLLRIKAKHQTLNLTSYYQNVQVVMPSLDTLDYDCSNPELTTFDCTKGIQISSIQNSSNGNVDVATAITFPFESNVRYLTGGFYQDAFFDLFAFFTQTVPASDMTPIDGVAYEVIPILLKRGKVGNIRPQSGTYEIELRSIIDDFDQEVTRYYTKSCNARKLGDSYCQVDLDSYMETGTVTGVISKRAFTDTSRTEADQYFMLGKLEWTSGDNQYLTVPVKNNLATSTQIQLYGNLPFDIQIGDDYKIWPGCQRRYTEDCIDKYDNSEHYQGLLILLDNYDKLEKIGLI